MFPAIGVRGQVFARILDPAHRVVAAQREPGERDLLSAQHALVAEAAADVGRDHADVAVTQPQAFAQPGLHRMRKLRRGHEREHAQARIAIGEHAAPFERRHTVARGADLARHRDVRRLGGFLHVLGEGDEDVVLPMLVHERRIRCLRRQHVGDRGKLVVFDDHPARDVLGLRPRAGQADRDDLADVAELVGCEDRLGRMLEAAQRRIGGNRLDAGEVLGREHRVAAFLGHRDLE